MNTQIKNVVTATAWDAQYDEKAKCLLGQKIILAHILVKTVAEFNGMDPKDVVPLIEGTPSISVVPVENGLTNVAKGHDGQRIVGFNTENNEVNEGMIRFDIVFYLCKKDGLRQIIVNIEAQKDNPSGYDILNRGIFYVSRMISSQKERDFEHTNFNDIKSVYSIWICMNMKSNTVNHVHLSDNQLLGTYEWKGHLDLFNIVLVGLATKLPEREEQYELHRLLGALLSKELIVSEKLAIIETEFDIPIVNDIREDVNVMCNLSQGIREAAKEEERKEIALTLAKQGVPLEFISSAAKVSTAVLGQWLEEDAK